MKLHEKIKVNKQIQLHLVHEFQVMGLPSLLYNKSLTNLFT